MSDSDRTVPDDLKPGDKVICTEGGVGELVSHIEDDRWVVFDLDWDDEYVWDLGRRGVDEIIRRPT